jgi:hypothetical protein
MANTCDDAFQQILDLQKQQQELRRQLSDSERARKAGETFTRAEVGNQIILPGAGRAPRVLDDKELSRGLQQLANNLESADLEAHVQRSFGESARPVGAEGLFQNYDRILREVDVSKAEDYAKLAEALGLTWRDIDPKDHAFVTQVYGPERMPEMVAQALKDFGVTVPEVAARMANDAAGFAGMVERMTRIRLFADRSKKAFMVETGRIADAMEALPGAVVSDSLKQDAFRTYKLALLAERHFAYARRRTAQALRSLQDDMGEGTIPDFTDSWLTSESGRLDPGGAGEAVKGPQETLGLTPDDVSNDSVIGKIIEAVDEGPAGLKTLRDIQETLELDGIDPKAKLDEGWFNATMRRGRAFAKDSQLSGVTTQIKSGEMTNMVMMLYGPLQKTFKNGMTMVPAGTDSLKRLGLVEAAKISAQSYSYALHATRIGMKKMVKDAYFKGRTHFGGNPDVYGSRMTANKEVEKEANRIARQEWSQKNFLANVAMAGPKLNVAARLKLKELWHDMPLQPALRMLGTFDEVHGKFQYLFHLMSDLEVKARAESVTLGLDTEAKRNAWVQDQLEQAVYQATPTEANIKAFRKRMKAGYLDDEMEAEGIDSFERLTDQQVMDVMVRQSMAGAPTFSTQASVRAFDYAAGTRMQNTPGSELLRFGGSSLDPLKNIDSGVRELKRNWMFDTVLPYWRAPANALLFDLRLATSPFYDPIKMTTLALKGKAGSEEFAEVASRWAISMGLLALFGAADQAGLIEGNTNPDPAKRNSFMGMPYLGGLPILSTLFLWKDVKDALDGGGASDLDGNEAYNGIAQVLTGYIMRGTGIAQLQQLVTAFGDGNMDAWDALVAFAGFQIQGNYLPFSGAARSVDRTMGTDIANQYRDGKDSPSLVYNQGVLETDTDDPFAPVLKKLRDLAYNTVPVLAGLPGNRKDQDWLGSPRGHIAGIDFARVIPIGFPGAWPRDPIYPELENLGQLDPPLEFRRRNLDGVGMSAELQREAIDIYGTTPGDSLLATNAMLGKSVNISLPIRFSTVLPNGVRIVDGETVRIDLAPFLEKHVKGKKVADAFRSLFNDPIYRAMEGDPKLTSNLALRDQPPAVRRRQPGQVMVKAIKDYYLDVTRMQLEQRARAGTSPEAKAWSDAKTRAVQGATKDSMDRLQPLIRALGGGQ